MVNDKEFEDTMRAALGEHAQLYVIIARGKFAVRFGPMPFPVANAILAWGESEHVPVMITADMGGNWDSNLAASLFGDTRQERADFAAQHKKQFDDAKRLVLLLGAIQRQFYMGALTSPNIDRLAAIDAALKPYEKDIADAGFPP